MSIPLVTIKDIAQRADLSIGTVDRVLHGRGRVSKETELKVRSIIKETGYKANILASNLSLQATFKFGVIIPFSERGSDYWEMLQAGISKATEELSTLKVTGKIINFNRYSSDSFLKAGKKALKYGLDGLIIAPVLEDACRSFIESLPGDSGKKIPYVYVDSSIPDTKPLAFIGQNSFQSGVCGARLMQLITGNEGNVLVLRMSPDDLHIKERVKGFRSFFEWTHPEKVHEFKVEGSCNDDEKFDLQVKSYISQTPECRGVFVTNAAAHRVVQAMRTCGCRNVKVIGYDCTEENRRLVANGAIDFIISQRTEQQGYKAIYTLFRSIVLKEPCVNQETMPIDIVMAENLSDYQ